MVCLELGSDSEVRDYGGFTPMQLAANRQRDDMVWLCQQYGASSNQLDSIEIECDDDSSDYSEESDVSTFTIIITSLWTPHSCNLLIYGFLTWFHHFFLI